MGQFLSTNVGKLRQLARDGDLKGIEELVEADPGVVKRIKRFIGDGPLHVAAYYGHAHVSFSSSQ